MVAQQLEAIGARVAASDVRGRTTSFASFYSAHHSRVLAICHALADGRSSAEDIAQEAFVRAYLRWDRVAVMERPDAWIRRVAANLAISRRRRLAAEARALLRLPRPRDRTSAPEDEDVFWEAVRRLPPRQAQAVALRYADDLSIHEIAGVMRCAEGTVKAHLHNARATLAQRLGLGEGMQR